MSFDRVGCTYPESSVARLCSVAGPPSLRQGERKRVTAIGSTGPSSPADTPPDTPGPPPARPPPAPPRPPPPPPPAGGGFLPPPRPPPKPRPGKTRDLVQSW